ncbi:hypothetical protein RCL1_001589 [Eukaryota sp. TZLM3-RCL]
MHQFFESNPMVYEACFDPSRIVKLTYGTTKGCYFGQNAISKFEEILEDIKPSGIGFVTGKSSYKSCGAWKVIEPLLAARNIPYKHFDGTSANPTGESVTAAVNLFRGIHDDKFIIVAIGGGSPIDCAKSVAVLMEYPDKTVHDLYFHRFTPEKATKLVAINLTAGTGTEVDMFAVVSLLDVEPPVKPVLATPVIHPYYSINDPNLTKSLGRTQTMYTALDLLNHIMESVTTTVRTPFSLSLGLHAVQLTKKYLPIVLEDLNNDVGRYWLMYSAAIAGMAFNESLLHATHAIEHTLSAVVPDLAHGLGLAMIMPAVFRHIYPAVGPILAEVFGPLIGDSFVGAPEEAEAASAALRAWLESVGMKDTLSNYGFKEADIPKLVQYTRDCPGMAGLLSLCPIPVTDEDMATIFRRSL